MNYANRTILARFVHALIHNEPVVLDTETGMATTIEMYGSNDGLSSDSVLSSLLIPKLGCKFG